MGVTDLEEEAKALAKRGLISDKQKKNIKTASNDGVKHDFAPDAASAQETLKKLQGEGRRGYVLHIGADGTHEIRHWPDDTK